MTRTSARCAPLAVVALALACGGGYPALPGGESAPRRGVSLRAEDRVVIPTMTIVRAVAVSDRYAFVGTQRALGVYDRQFAAWLPPVTRLDGWPDSPVVTMLADPADPAALWFAADNIVYHYRVGFDGVVATIVPERVSPAAFFVDAADPAAGVIVSGGPAGYLRVSPTGFVQPLAATSVAPRTATGARARIVPQTAASVYAQFRALQNFERLLTRDDALRTWPVLSAAANPAKNEVWLGTAGGGVFKVDPVFTRGEHVPFGLVGDGAGAVARAADGVWIGSLANGLSPRGGLTFVESELRQWRWVDGGVASPFNGTRIAAISIWESSLWVGTDRGLVHVDGRTGNVLRRWDELAGLPSALVLAVEATRGGAWVGTERGVAFVRSGVEPGAARTAGVDEPVLIGRAARALTRRGDTLWIGSDAGLLVLAPGATQPLALRATAADARLRVPVTALATADSIVAVGTANGDVFRVHTRTGEVLDALSVIAPSIVGRVNAIALDATTMWVAGSRGVMIARRDSPLQRFLQVGADLPGESYGVVLTPQYAWIATRDGAVRLRRLNNGLVR